MSIRNSLSVVKNDLQHSIGSLLRTQSNRAGVDPAPRRHHVGEVEFCGCDHFLSWVLKGDRESLAERVEAGGLINQLIEILRCQMWELTSIITLVSTSSRLLVRTQEEISVLNWAWVLSTSMIAGTWKLESVDIHKLGSTHYLLW